jgi:hypothetical protein
LDTPGCHPSRLADHLHGVLGEQPVAPDVGRLALSEVPVEGFLHRAHCARREHGPGDVGAADGLPSAAGDDRLLGDVDVLPGEELHDLLDARPPVFGEQVLEKLKLGVHRVDEVAEDVDLPPGLRVVHDPLVEKGRELDPGHEPHSQGPGGPRSGLQAGHGVVVGQGPGLGSGRRGPPGDLDGGVLSVGSSRMSM